MQKFIKTMTAFEEAADDNKKLLKLSKMIRNDRKIRENIDLVIDAVEPFVLILNGLKQYMTSLLECNHIFNEMSDVLYQKLIINDLVNQNAFRNQYLKIVLEDSQELFKPFNPYLENSNDFDVMGRVQLEAVFKDLYKMVLSEPPDDMCFSIVKTRDELKSMAGLTIVNRRFVREHQSNESRACEILGDQCNLLDLTLGFKEDLTLYDFYKQYIKIDIKEIISRSNQPVLTIIHALDHQKQIHGGLLKKALAGDFLKRVCNDIFIPLEEGAPFNYMKKEIAYDAFAFLSKVMANYYDGIIFDARGYYLFAQREVNYKNPKKFVFMTE